MNIKTMLLAGLMILPLANVANATPSNNSTITSKAQKEEAKIKQLIQAYRDALKSGSPQKVVALYTKNGVLMPANAPTTEGTEALTATYQHIFNAVALDLQFEILEIKIYKNYAFVRSTSDGMATIKANNSKVPEQNRELFVLEKVGGNWKIARYMFNKVS